MCGADLLVSRLNTSCWGSPPRVRSRLKIIDQIMHKERITSACAEQTSSGYGSSWSCGDHLRVCGADDFIPDQYKAQVGSPPRVRSRRRAWSASPRSRGITSACAEQTWRYQPIARYCWDHLRVCGADAPMLPLLRHRMGSPPRVRSRLSS